jgi:hypothetical protein
MEIGGGAGSRREKAPAKRPGLSALLVALRLTDGDEHTA